MPYVSVAEERVFYAYHDGAHRKAPTLILIHGAGGNHQFWGHAVRSVSSATTYAPDLPGHGRSGGTGRWSIVDYAAFATAFMDALELRQAVVAGHSMGGATAMQMSLDYATRVSGLVLVGTGARLRVLPAILEGTLSNFQSTIELVCEYAYSPRTSRQLVRHGQRQMLKVAPQTVHDDFAACDGFDVMDRLADIRCPTLVVCGTDDRLTPPKYSALLAERIHNAQLRFIEGAGHMVMIEKPEVLGEAIESTLAGWKL